ncbi:MAG TPA: delta-60 repeat domain-containing protein, partial [Pyrinomonadaceae bacterium]|nr:delta-60 repeat domain-containing protein [Pyrinomonadaceae bacterium]
MKTFTFRYALSITIKSLALAALFLSFNTITQAVGILDRTFGANGRAATTVGSGAQSKAVAIQPDGKIIVAGDVLRSGTNRDVVLVRYNSNGTLDTNFGDGGKVFAAISPGADNARDIALAPDGKIVIVGSIQTPDPVMNTDFFVARFTANGGLDTNFANNGVAIINQGSNDDFYAVTVQADGKIVTVGRTSD